MTQDERDLLIKTAQALGSMSQLLASGAGLHDFADLFSRINQGIAPLVDRIANGCTCKPIETNLPHLRHLIATDPHCPFHSGVRV